MAWQRSRIRLDNDNRAFWTGGAEGRLNITRCADCGQFTHPPREICRHCQSENVAPHAVSGTGKIDTYTVNHQKWAPDMEVPFVIARVRLDDAPGVFLTTNIVNCPVEEVDIDQPVRVTFEEQAGLWYPLFEKVPA
ncbi:OB-fold domain-containing protein [Novosphingobium sp.]|uniref:Zn-ribbon domain-containing OB-fold protein n=1 Tax=Novosphingobium sp. TaxID=1874826 RepID=UPI0025DEF9DC|nr:OB-fold domain-containing protein [Novosphingobium sp.]